MNTFSVVRIVLIVFQAILLAMMIILFSRSLIGVLRKEQNREHTSMMVNTALEGANLVFGLVGAYQVHFLYTLIFAILQTVIIVFEFFFTLAGWVYIPWIGCAILAYILAFMIKKGYSNI